MLDDSLLIRQSATSDLPQICRLTQWAFSESEWGENGETDLVRQLARDPAAIAWVACDTRNQDKPDIVGHVQFSPARIQWENGEIWQGLGLGPMSVAPPQQGQGIGTRLIKQGLKEISEAQHSFVMVYGHPALYQSCGFGLARNWNLRHGFSQMPQEYLMCLPLTHRFEQPGLGLGRAFYDQAFGDQWNETSS